MDAAAAEIPEKPSGAKGVNCSMFITGSANATKRESAAILITTNTAFTVALSRVPMTNSQVTRPAILMAGRLINPPSKGPRTSIWGLRSEEHTSELQSLMRISYAVYGLNKKIKTHQHHSIHTK